MLGREGAQSSEAAEGFLEKAVGLLKQEAKSEEQSFGYSPEESGYALAVADLAQVKWNSGKQQEAVELITSCFEETRENVWYEVRAIVRDLAVSFLLQSGKAQQAQTLLFSDTQDNAQWHGLNALVHFALSGDCLNSRTALTLSLTMGTMIADALLKGDISVFDDSVDAPELRRHVADTEPSWQVIAGAVEWLQRISKDPCVMHNREMLEISIPHGDQSRWKRWEDTVKRADHYLLQDDVSEAKKLYKSALREAERIDYSYGPFYETMTAIVDFTEQAGESFEELRSRIESRAARLSSDSSAKRTDACAALSIVWDPVPIYE